MGVPEKADSRASQTERGVFNNDKLEDELKDLCLEGKSSAKINGMRVGVGLLRVQFEKAVKLSGEEPDVVLGAIKRACGLPDGNEDKPYPPFSIRWISHDPGRLSRMVGAYLKQD